MSTTKVAITLDRTVLHQVDRLVAEGRFPSRSRAIQEAVRRQLERTRRRADPMNSGALNSLHLGETAIHKQFRSRDVAAVVGCEKYHSLCDLIGRAEPAERNTVGNHLQALLARF